MLVFCLNKNQDMLQSFELRSFYYLVLLADFFLLRVNCDEDKFLFINFYIW